MVIGVVKKGQFRSGYERGEKRAVYKWLLA